MRIPVNIIPVRNGFECSLCGKKYKYQGACENHIKRVKGISVTAKMMDNSFYSQKGLLDFV